MWIDSSVSRVCSWFYQVFPFLFMTNVMTIALCLLKPRRISLYSTITVGRGGRQHGNMGPVWVVKGMKKISYVWNKWNQSAHGWVTLYLDPIIFADYNCGHFGGAPLSLYDLPAISAVRPIKVVCHFAPFLTSLSPGKTLWFPPRKPKIAEETVRASRKSS